MALRNPSSLVRSDESIMREPTLTTRPPSRPGSTFAVTRASRPSLAFKVRRSSAVSDSLSGRAATTSASTSPFCRPSNSSNARMISGNTKSRRFLANVRMKRTVRGVHSIRPRTAFIPARWSSAENTGALTSRARSGQAASCTFKAAMSRATASTACASVTSSKSAVAYRPATPELCDFSPAKFASRHRPRKA